MFYVISRALDPVEQPLFRKVVQRFPKCADAHPKIDSHVALRFETRTIRQAPGRNLANEKLSGLHVFWECRLVGVHQHTGKLIQY